MTKKTNSTPPIQGSEITPLERLRSILSDVIYSTNVTLSPGDAEFLKRSCRTYEIIAKSYSAFPVRVDEEYTRRMEEMD